MITRELQMKGSTVINASGDADVDIVRTAIQASRLQTTTLIGEDTDLLILLYYAEKSNSNDLLFRSDKSTPPKVYDVHAMKQVLGNELSTHLLFITPPVTQPVIVRGGVCLTSYIAYLTLYRNHRVCLTSHGFFIEFTKYFFDYIRV